jgi:hypothetical protein
LTGAAVVQRQWDLPGDAPAPLDYDGDGVDDSAIYRAGDGGWYIRRSSDGAFTYLQWGLPADRPVGSK